MIRFLALLGSACMLGAIGLALIDAERYVAASLILLVAGLIIFGLLAIRRAYYKVKGVVSDARAFTSGNIQHARIVSVGEPKGWFNPEANVVLELEGEDGTKRQFDRDMPVPWPMALTYRLGKRFNAPGMGTDLGQLVAVELKREGLNVSVSRPGAPGESPEPESAAR